MEYYQHLYMLKEETREMDWNLYTKAIHFIASAHEGQRYGDYSHLHHLMAVERVLGIFNLHPMSDPKRRKINLERSQNLLLACFLHDTIEDTPITYEDLVESFNVPIANMVLAVTNREIPDEITDKEERRRLKFEGVYEKIRETPDAIFVKLCDRVANIESCLNYRLTRDREKALSKLKMYVREYDHFREKLYDPSYSNTKSIWKHLDFLIKEAGRERN